MGLKMRTASARRQEAAPDWRNVRTLLTVPADRSDFLAKALLRGADALLIDLEDGVDPCRKGEARRAVHRAIDELAGRGTLIAVRINSDPELIEPDIVASIHPMLDACVIPKVERPEDVHRVARHFGDRCPALGVTIEHPRALPLLHAIVKADPRIAAVVFGAEDFAAAMGVPANTRSLSMPAQQVALAAHSAGLAALGVPGPVGWIDDVEGSRTLAILAFELGFTGIPCIHPDQVAVINEASMPSAEELEEAEAILAAFNGQSEIRRGAFRFRGRMIDLPVVSQARRVIARTNR